MRCGMSISNEFFRKMTENHIVFTKEDYLNFMKLCKDNKVENFEFYVHNINDKNYKFSRSFFGKSFIHPKNVNPYRINYNLSNIMNELKLNKQKMTDLEKLDKIINYVKIID